MEKELIESMKKYDEKRKNEEKALENLIDLGLTEENVEE